MPRTAQCTSGSSAQAAAPAFFLYGSYVPTLTWWQAAALWLVNVLSGLPDGPISTATFCATEPLGDLPTTADYLSLAIPPLAWATGAFTRFGNQVKADAFAQYCQCNAPSSSTCEALWQTFTPSTGYGSNNNQSGLQFQPQANGYVWGAHVNIQCSAGAHYELRLWDPTTTTIVAYIQFYPTSGVQDVLFAAPYPVVGGSNYTMSLCTLSGTNTYQGVAANVANVHTDSQVHYGTYTEIANNSFCPTGSRTYQEPLQPWFCPPGASPPVTFVPTPPAAPTPPTGFPTTPTAPTCGSYQDICNFLQSIDVEIRGLASQLTLLRLLVGQPILVESTVHSGLTGIGTFAVSALGGLKVELTTIPATAGTEVGDPATRWNVARISTSSASGLELNQWVGSSPTVLRIPLDAVTVGFYVAPGAVARITELTSGL
jgi:hypothetical protein